MKNKEENKVVSDTWENAEDHYKRNDKIVYWEAVPEIARYQYRTITGDEDLTYFDYILNILKKSRKKTLRGLSIGCGEGSSPEMLFCESGLFEKFDVFDLSEGLIKKQAQLPRDKSLHMLNYQVVDLNEVKLEKDNYDLIWSVGTIHHVKNLDSLFKNINKSLRKDAIFVCREYVGPDYLQLSDKQISIVDALLKVIPSKYLIHTDGEQKKYEMRVDKDELIKIDPSESVCSNKIMDIMKKRLKITQLANTGGTILHPFLNGIAFNFTNGESVKYLKVLIELEELLIQNKELPSDYVFVTAKRKRVLGK